MRLNSKISTFGRSLIACSVLALVFTACNNAEQEDNTDEDRAEDTTDPEDTSDPADTTDPNESEIDKAPSWQGSWRVSVDWSATCEYGWDAVETIEGSNSWTLVFYGPSDNLEARVNNSGWYTLTGSGDDDGILLCGSFPMFGISGNQSPSGNSNNLCINASEVMNDKEVHGFLEGRFQGDSSEKCDMNLSPLVLSR